MTQLLAPGGWIELTETDLRNRYDLPLNEEPSAVDQVYTIVKRQHIARGVGFDFVTELRSWLEAAGLEEVQERSFAVPRGGGADSPDTRVLNGRMTRMSAEGMIPVAKGKLANILTCGISSIRERLTLITL